MALRAINIGPEFCVQGCDIARACEITSDDTVGKRGSYIQYIGPFSILYTIYDISCIVCKCKVYIQYIGLTTSKG